MRHAMRIFAGSTTATIFFATQVVTITGRAGRRVIGTVAATATWGHAPALKHLVGG
jgi:hypothetical protein